MPAIGDELSVHGQHTATYTNRSNLLKETTVTDSVDGCTKIELNDTGLQPCI